MGRAQFEYDEVGNTFYYVIISFYAVILVGATHFLWPSSYVSFVNKSGCQCEGDKRKREKKEANRPWQTRKRIFKAIVLIVLWGIFAWLAMKISTIEVTHEEYDPYKILGLDQGATSSEIKKAYHKLSKQYHPDRGGDEEQFNVLAKAYQALTNEESRENWEKYGNPDGPKATTFGIALPKWIVSENYGNWVLALYGLVFIVLLPVIVGIWWYNSMKYSVDKVLNETSQIFAHFIHKTPAMEVDRALTVLTGAREFWRNCNKEIIESEQDDIELPPLMKEFKSLAKSKEYPFNAPYSIKARTLLHCYLSHLDVNSDRLRRDQDYIIDRILPLLNEFFSILLQFVFHAPYGNRPTLGTVENVLKLYPMFVQGLWLKNSSLMQLPHLTEHNIAFLRRKGIDSPLALAQLNEHKRKTLLNTLDESEYDDVITVLNMMPKLEVETEIEVQGEDDRNTVTVGSIVTIRVTLSRTPLLDLEVRKNELANEPQKPEKREEDQPEQKKKKPWEKQKPKKKNNKNKKQGKGKKKTAELEEANKDDKEEKIDNKGSDDESGHSDSDSNATGNHSDNDEEEKESESDSGSDSDDDWGDENVPSKKDVLLDREPTNYHEVHCPYYSKDKHEWWFLYLVEKKSKTLCTNVMPCKSLDKKKTIEMRIQSPGTVGEYKFTLHVRSDSYVDSDYTHEVKMIVQAAREPNVVVYQDSEDDEEINAVTESSDEYTEGSASEDED